MSTPKRIGLLGGTFDPVHKGHIAIARSFVSSKYIDALWVLLSPAPPHKEGEHFASYNQRKAMLMAAFEEIANVQVSTLENRLPTPSYTVQTLVYLKEQYPHKSFFLCVGKDSFFSFTSWYQWQKILSYAPLLVAERPNMQNKNLPVSLLEKTQFIHHTPVAISSTEIRQRLKEGKPVEQLLPKKVLSIIKKEHIYQ